MASDFWDIFGNTFGTNTAKTYEEQLNKYYCKHMENYYTALNNAKAAGYKVFRNKEGKHVVKRKEG
jgi:hypothetical protein